MTITAAQVKELREVTGVGMMECKNALVENNGDMEKAIVWLRERGMARAAKKAGRAAAEGTVVFAISPDHREAAMLELNCETDFAGKNEDFRNFASKAVKLALQHKATEVEALKAVSWEGATSLDKQLTDLIAKVGENMSLRRVAYLKADQGVVVGYSHMDGKIGALVALTGKPSDKLFELGSDLAMHVAASNPRYLRREEVSAAELEQEKAIARKRLEEQGKVGDIMEKALIGHVNKYYGEVCFLDQPFVKEPKLTVAKYAQQSSPEAVPTAFVRFQLGEGIEVKKENFADEVAAQIKPH